MAFPVRSITPDLFLAELALTHDAIALDVRTAEEVRNLGTIKNATHLDYLDTAFEEHVDSLDRLVPYYIFCDTGKRSRLACELMASKGFMLVAWLEGGLNSLDPNAII